MARLALGLALLALTTAACTVVSGVDDMELRTGPAAPAASGGGGSAANPFAAEAGTPETSTNIETPQATGPATCGAQGSWSGCVAPPTLSTCASICAAQGHACVDSCCATDELGDFSAKVGMVYALTSECSLPAITSQATFGLCTDPLVLPAGFGDVRCCCK